MLEITGQEISELNDSDLRSLVGLLCEAELRNKKLPTTGVTWGGHHTAKDGGLDVRVQIDHSLLPQGEYIPRSNTGFQVKKPDMPPFKIKEEMRPTGELRQVIRDLTRDSGAYIIVSSTGSTSDSALANRRTAIRDALSGLDNASSLKTDFYDRERIAGWVRCHPALILWVREKIGKPIQGWQPFGNWAHAPGGINEEYYLDTEVRVHNGTENRLNGMTVIEGINSLRKALHPSTSSVRLAGLSGVGKTRLVQALFDERIGETALNQSLAFYTDLSHSPNPEPRNFAERLLALKTPAILVVDNCPPELHAHLTTVCKAPQSLISLITVEYDVREDQPYETQVFRLEPSSIGLIETILQHRFCHISQVDSLSIAKFSGGNARIAIALAKTIESGETLGDLKDEYLFQRLFRQRNESDSTLLKSAEVCSLVYSFDCQAAENLDTELRLLASLVDNTVTKLFGDISELIRRDLVQQRGIWRAVLPHAIANRLARKALENIPLKSILEVFEKEGSERFLKSFSKRLSYLHQSQLAISIAHRWLGENGLLENISNLNDLGITLLNNIAPLVPEAVLKKIKLTADEEGGQDFSSRSNSNFSKFTLLLRSLAYDQKLFDESAELLCRFALTEDKQENCNSIRDCLKSLFYIYLSGTHATPEQRLHIIEGLVNSQSEDKQELGLLLLSCALEAWYFSGYPSSFDFGAHSRNYGYMPKTKDEVLHWFNMFVELAVNLCLSEESIALKAKQIFAKSFRGLWTKARLFDKLEAASKIIISKGPWSEGWQAARSTIKFDADSMDSEILERLRKLATMLAPGSLLEKARTYALAQSWGDLQLIDTEDDDPVASSQDKVERATREIGQRVAREEEVFNDLLPEVLAKNGIELYSFGQGLGEGCLNFPKMWQSFLNQLNAIDDEKRNYKVLIGFLHSASKIDNQFSEQILNEAVSHNLLGRVFPLLQISVEISECGIERLVKSLELGIAPTCMFSHLGYGRVHESINDTNFTKLLSLIMLKADGLAMAIELLAMRLLGRDSRGYEPSDELIILGQDCLKQMHFDQDRPTHAQGLDHNLSRIAEACLVGDAAKNVAKDLCHRLAQALARPFYSPDYHSLLDTLATNQPVAFLEGFLGNNTIEIYRIMKVFSNKNSSRPNPLSKISDDVIIAWCEADPHVRYPMVASCISPYRKGTDEKTLEWTPISINLIDTAPNPHKVLNNLQKTVYEISGSGFRADNMEKCLGLLSDLKGHENSVVKEWAQKEERNLKDEINSVRKGESDWNRTQVEGFE